MKIFGWILFVLKLIWAALKWVCHWFAETCYGLTERHPDEPSISNNWPGCMINNRKTDRDLERERNRL